MKLEVEFWKNVILSGKKYEPQNKKSEAAYDIAEFLLSRENKKKAA